jgi:mono/diheme cytochrome c family protein
MRGITMVAFRLCSAVVAVHAIAILAWLVMPASADLPTQNGADKRPAIDFARQIRPILSENCFTCHGPDDSQRKAKLRVDTKEGAFKPLRDGTFAIVGKEPGKSMLLQRIRSHDPDEQMPPPTSNKKISPQQADLIERWIAEGAAWSEHWAFFTPRRPELPSIKNVAWTRNPIDHFVLARLEAEGLAPAPEADRIRLMRRLTFDLTGLPPTLAEIDAFLADKSADAYEKVVERLLASPHFGERMALDWLDAARYADTHGYHIDSGRDMTRWREWVIDAFNTNMPYDRFIVEQLAGDLLPGATVQQKIASGFNRNHMINFEGGAIPEEYLNAYIVDRVNTTSTVFLGLTVACAQ